MLFLKSFFLKKKKLLIYSDASVWLIYGQHFMLQKQAAFSASVYSVVTDQVH